MLTCVRTAKKNPICILMGTRASTAAPKSHRVHTTCLHTNTHILVCCPAEDLPRNNGCQRETVAAAAACRKRNMQQRAQRRDINSRPNSADAHALICSQASIISSAAGGRGGRSSRIIARGRACLRAKHAWHVARETQPSARFAPNSHNTRAYGSPLEHLHPVHTACWMFVVCTRSAQAARTRYFTFIYSISPSLDPDWRLCATLCVPPFLPPPPHPASS